MTAEIPKEDLADEAVSRHGDVSNRATSHSGDRVTRTALVVSSLIVASSLLGLFRDLSLAGLFGASGNTDAFLVAWTIPETVTVLLMQGAMSYLLVPVFVSELARAGTISRIVQQTLLPLMAVLGLLVVLTVTAAPLLIHLLAPGIAEMSLATACFRVASLTVLFMGLSGFIMAALQANKRFVRPATSYVAYNVGILATMYAFHAYMGVFSAALGLAVGSALMVLVQVPAFLKVTTLRGLRLHINRRLAIAATGYIPIAAYAGGRQAQILVERIVGSMLEPGSISYMNYASKVAQMAMLLALTAATVSFPALAGLAGDRAGFAARVDRELRRATLLIMPAMAFLIFFARPSVQLLFQHGAFDSADVDTTASVMRIYSLGLLGQVFISVGALVYFSGGKRDWAPAAAAAVGLLITIALDVSLAETLDVAALAVGNAVGISLSAVLIWWSIRRRIVAYNRRALVRTLLLVGPMAFVAASSGWLICKILALSATAQVFLGGTVTVILFFVQITLAGFEESSELRGKMRKTAETASNRLRRTGR